MGLVVGLVLARDRRPPVDVYGCGCLAIRPSKDKFLSGKLANARRAAFEGVVPDPNRVIASMQAARDEDGVLLMSEKRVEPRDADDERIAIEQFAGRDIPILVFLRHPDQKVQRGMTNRFLESICRDVATP